MDRDPFVAELTNGMPARPLNMTAIEATNRGVGRHAVGDAHLVPRQSTRSGIDAIDVGAA